ncbi:tryptophan halogenase family protein [Cellvibrio sp. QJXJ]|uniref:tryptophan halogenase family protein n=1 Tax=Cellvibrio sp. QJXJ TaxID=2964606 RepID=UPI0021C2FA85|nr:tryptophan halogenase family protein [Cellvibrio sp. QJXJ]UUA73821.1 tryptophan 7-halogenase [Cellvibrio sp. QJXJ]
MLKSHSKKIIVLGGGTAGWVTGAILSKKWETHGYQIVVVDTAEIPTIGVGEASIPTIYDLLNYIEISDQDLVKHCQATFKYGIQFENWSRPGERYMHGFGNMGHNLGQAEFFKIWLSTARYFKNPDLTPYIPSAVAAYSDKFSRGSKAPENTNGLFYPLSNLLYALHFDASLLARLLREKALHNGAIHISKHIVKVETDENGITALIAEDGETLSADLYVDCSGMHGVLNKQALKANFDNWQAYLPCDTAIAAQTTLNKAPRLYTRSIAHAAGWRWEIQLQNRTGNGIVYCSKNMDYDTAKQHLLEGIEGDLLTTPRKIEFITGRLSSPWTLNSVAIGLSAGFLEPLESTSIHLICAYARKLRDSIDNNELNAVGREKFNRAWCSETEGVRDFLMVHYLCNQRDEDSFWKERKSGPRPASLDKLLNEFSKTGWISPPEASIFGTDSWLEVLIGQKFFLNYEKFSMPADIAPHYIQFLQNVSYAIKNKVNKIPDSHQSILGTLRAEI